MSHHLGKKKVEEGWKHDVAKNFKAYSFNLMFRFLTEVRCALRKGGRRDSTITPVKAWMHIHMLICTCTFLLKDLQLKHL